MSSVRSQPQIVAIKAPQTKTPLSAKGIKTIVIPESAIDRIPIKSAKPKITVTKVVKATLVAKPARPATAAPVIKQKNVIKR